ncbi:MAG: hypothetical protein M0R37_10575 [Bacteroidales bacterium]|jgi:hypothetical protein|nr:hypothetical protein [Bacteroidales bacterium]
MGNTASARAKVVDETLRCVGFQTLAITTDAQSLTLPTSAQAAQCQVQDQPIRWRADGTAPTSTVGAEANDGDEITIQGRATMRSFEVIRHSEGSAGGTLVCHYYG